jgi:hypothetical protein
MNSEINIFMFVLFGDRYFGATGCEVHINGFTEPVFSERESFLQDVGDVILAR